MRASTAAVAALLLVAMSGGGAAGNGAVGDPPGGAAGDRAGVAMQPGQWELVTRMTALEMPGAPEDLVAAVRAQLPAPLTQSKCVTPAQAADPSTMMGGAATNPACEISEAAFSGGAIRMRLICRRPDAPAMRYRMSGGYTAATMDLGWDIETEVQGLAGAETQAMRMHGTVSARRTGACPG